MLYCQFTSDMWSLLASLLVSASVSGVRSCVSFGNDLSHLIVCMPQLDRHLSARLQWLLPCLLV